MLQRAVIKLSGEALSHPLATCDARAENELAPHAFADEPFNTNTINEIARQLGVAIANGTQIALVVGGGNFWRGRMAPLYMDRVKADQIGMAATVMNALYLTEAFKPFDIKSVVMTPFTFGNMTQVYEKNHALCLMAESTVVINAAGLGHPYFTTDTVTALRAAELNADCVLFSKNGVGGVYDRLPTVRGARMYRSLSYERAISNQLQVADITALQLAREADISSYVFGLGETDALIRICESSTGSRPCFGTLLSNAAEEEFYVNPYPTV